MKKRIILIGFLLTANLLFSCTPSDKTETETANQIPTTACEIPTETETSLVINCPIINDSSKFTPVSKEQSFQFGTDYDNRMVRYLNFTRTNDGFYYFMDNQIYYCDKDMKYCSLLYQPEKVNPDSNEALGAIYSYTDFQFYNDNLYTFDYETNNRKALLIKKFNTNTLTFEPACNLNDIPTDSTGSNNGLFVYGYEWIIHKGYIYYYYLFNSVDESYYSHGSHYIYRTALDGSSSPECLFQLPKGCFDGKLNLTGAGSYVYMLITQPELPYGDLYRYNIESHQMEHLELLGNAICTFAIENGIIYYMNDSEFENIYRYNPFTQEHSLYITMQTGHSIYPYSDLFCDKDYLIAHYYDPETEAKDYGYIIYNHKGEKIKEISTKKWELNFLGSDEKRLYFKQNIPLEEGENNPYGVINSSSTTYISFCYIEKSDLTKGNYTLHYAEIK